MSNLPATENEGLFKWEDYDPNDSDADVQTLIPNLDQASRRILYASGFLTGRN